MNEEKEWRVDEYLRYTEPLMDVDVKLSVIVMNKLKSLGLKPKNVRLHFGELVIEFDNSFNAKDIHTIEKEFNLDFVYFRGSTLPNRAEVVFVSPVTVEPCCECEPEMENTGELWYEWIAADRAKPLNERVGKKLEQDLESFDEMVHIMDAAWQKYDNDYITQSELSEIEDKTLDVVAKWTLIRTLLPN